MSKSFLITSHTEGINSFEKKIILWGLVKNLKEYFPDCFIIITSQSEVDFETQQLADYIIVDKKTINEPHGAGEVALLNAGLKVLEQFGRKDCFKLVYDFIIDETNHQVFDQWLSHNKQFVGCFWKTVGLGIGSWCWWGTTDIQRKILDFDNLDMYLEWKIYQSILDKNLLDDCYIYDTNDDMFNGNWIERCDLVHDGGRRLKFNYGNVVAVGILDDLNIDQLPITIQSLIDQEKAFTHLLLVDARRDKLDLRVNPSYQNLLYMLGQKNISWHLIYWIGEKELYDYVKELDYDWVCWFNQPIYLDKKWLKKIYKKIILNRKLAIINDSDIIFYKNKIIELAEINNNIKQLLIDNLDKSLYTIDNL
jgi:hypothetical protein